MRTVRPLISRSKEVSELQSLLRAGTIVTIVGPPGVGKSRLAAELAWRASPEHQAVWLPVVDADDELVLASKLSALLGLEPGQDVLSAVAGQLALAPRLVVIDGCEWSLPATRRLVETVVMTAPNSQWLATSREPLGADAEILYSLRPLDEAASIELFCDRATRARAGEALPGSEEIAELCKLLDGLPLSIELVASRLADTPWPVVVAESRRRVPAAQLKAALHASHARLSDSKQLIFRHLAVFPAGFDPEAVLHVIPEHAENRVLDSLGSLSASSLISVQRGNSGGWEMLDTIRAFALEHLRAAGEEEKARRRHAEYCLEVARRAKPDLIGDRQVAVARRLEQHGADIRAALRWSRPAAPDLFVEIVCALRTWWLLSADLGAGRLLLREVPELAGPASLRAASAWLGALRISLELGLIDAAREEGRRAAAIYAAIGDSMRRRRSAVGLAWAAALLGELEQARDGLRASLAEAEAGDDRRGIYDAGWCLGQVEWRLGEGNLAAAALEKARQAAIAVGAHQLISHSEDAAGHLAFERGYADAARRYFRSALAAARQFAGAGLQVHALDNLARVELEGGDQERARALLLEALGLAVDHGVAQYRLGSVLEAFAWLAHLDRRQRRAIRLWHAAAALRRASGSATFELWAGSRPETPLWLERARKEAGPAARGCAAEGEALSPAEAVSLARKTGRGEAVADHLTSREAEVAVLVSEGLTNRAIAHRLGLSPRTVDTHLEHVRAKLNLTSRSGVAAWAAVRRPPE